MDTKRTADAIQRLVLSPNDIVDGIHEGPDWLWIWTQRRSYDARPADWAVATEDWVVDAVRVMVEGAPVFTTHGLLLPVEGDPLHLNRPEVMAKLGRRVGAGLTPSAYAELFGELYSWGIDGPIVYPFGATQWARPGSLVREADHFTRETVVPEAPPVAAPRFEQMPDGGWTLRFFSHNRVLLEVRVAVDVYEWTVTGSPDRDATWQRRTIAEHALQAQPWERPRP